MACAAAGHSVVELIVTDRLQLIPVTSKEASKDLHQVFLSLDVMRPFRGMFGALSSEEYVKFIDARIQGWKNGPFGLFAIYSKDRNEFIGSCALEKAGEDCAIENGVAELAYLVIRSMQNKSYELEAAKALMVYATKLFHEKVYVGNRPLKVVKTDMYIGSISYLGKIAKELGMDGPNVSKDQDSCSYRILLR